MTNQTFMTPDIYEPHGEVSTRLWLLLPLRLYVGVYFILAAISKVNAGMLSASELLTDKIGAMVGNPDYSHSLYHAFYNSFIEPYPGTFVFFLIFGELIVGLTLATGAFTRLSCLFGMGILLNFYLAPIDLGEGVRCFSSANVVPLAIMLFVAAITNAGRAYGVDHYIRDKLPWWLV